MYKKREPEVGQILTVEFVKNQRKGKKPVAVHEGIICFINRTYRGEFIEEHSIWQVEVADVGNRNLVVDPIQIVKSAAANMAEINERTKKLGEKFAKKYSPKHKKHSISYPYKRKQERS